MNRFVSEQNEEDKTILIKVSSHGQKQFIKEKLNLQAVSITFRNLSLEVQNIYKRQVKLLNNISGICPASKFTAIMGSSGAGKTTLLNILACRIGNTKKSILTGEVTANGVKYNYETFPQFASYVMQNDILMESMTPREAFQFVASFKYNDRRVIEKRVEETLKALGLLDCQYTYIGGFLLKGISGGERKRTSIGVELVTDPSVVLLDEPTSGLDSFTAFQIINYLKKLQEEKNKTIIITVHQPSTDILVNFDNIILLQLGELIYQGGYNYVIPYLSNIGYPCPENSNPLDYLLFLLNKAGDKQIIFQNMINYYRDNVDQQINDFINMSQNKSLLLQKRNTSVLYEIVLIAQRDFLNAYRSPMQIKARFFFAILYGFLHGGVFWNLGQKDDVYSLIGSLFVLTVGLGACGIFYNILAFIIEKPLFQREESSQLYKTYSYYIGKQAIEVPLSLIQPLSINLIAYWMCSYNSLQWENVFMHLIISFFFYNSVCSLGMMVSSAFNTLVGASSLGVTVLLPVVLFGGFFANPKTYWEYVSWLQYLSPVKYGYEAICLNEFKGKQFAIDPVELYGFTTGIRTCVGLLCIFIFVLRLIGLLFLYTVRVKLQ